MGAHRISLVRDSAGGPFYFVVHMEDITERKRAEEALRESEERFRIMADSCPTVMWVTDAEGGTQFINRAYREFCGTTSNRWRDKWQSLLHPDDAPEYVGIPARGAGTCALQGRSAHPARRWRVAVGRLRTRSRAFRRAVNTWATSASVRTSPSASRPSEPCEERREVSPVGGEHS